MSTYDIAARSLIQVGPLEMARFLLGRPDLTSVRKADPVIVKSERRMDTLMEVDHEGQPFLVHVEFQYGWERDLEGRMLEYGVWAHRALGLPVLSLVVLLGRKGGQGPAGGSYGWEVLGVERIRYSFEILRLWEVEASLFRREAPEVLLPLVPLMGGATEELVQECGRTIERSPRPVEERATLLTILNLFAGLGLGEGASRMMMGLWREIMMESPAYKMIREEGRQEGRQEGILQRSREDILEILETRFQAAPGELREALAELEDSELLRILFRKSVTAVTPEEVLEELRRHH